MLCSRHLDRPRAEGGGTCKNLPQQHVPAGWRAVSQPGGLLLVLGGRLGIQVHVGGALNGLDLTLLPLPAAALAPFGNATNHRVSSYPGFNQQVRKILVSSLPVVTVMSGRHIGRRTA